MKAASLVRSLCVAALPVALALVGCNSPAKLEFAAPPPARITERGPLVLPPVQAFDREGKVIDNVKIEVEALPAGVVLVRPEGIQVVNRGDATLTYTAGKATLLHLLQVRLPTRIELRCLPSCFGSVGSDTKLDTTVYSDEEALGDLQAPCSTDKASVAVVEGTTLKFVDKGETMLTCRLGEAEITKKIDVVAAPPPPPPPANDGDGAGVAGGEGGAEGVPQ